MDHLVDYIDILGMNFYPDGQVECYWNPRTRRYNRRKLPYGDPRRICLEQALRIYRERYGQKPVIVAETSVRGPRRVPWLTQLTDEALQAIAAGLPLQGLCWYPVLDVPDWGYLRHGHMPKRLRLAHAGLIRLERTPKGLRRTFSPRLTHLLRIQETRLQQALARCAAVTTPSTQRDGQAKEGATAVAGDRQESRLHQAMTSTVGAIVGEPER
jgi:hypothetical protein